VTLSAGAITLWQVQNLSGPTGLDASAALGVPTSADGGLTWKVPVSAASAFSALGSLLDGVYQTTVHANLVTDSFNQHLSGGDQTGLKFHRLFGDLNGDKRVNAGDYLAFSNAFGSTSVSANYNASFDFNHDGRVNSGDYLQFSNRFGKAFAYSG
ncbi:MAG: hypothetical protein JWM97_2146, partial [Phycisphaerales bacterium]|nr:hypothetical protein [Phycisphaerales bacterium]